CALPITARRPPAVVGQREEQDVEPGLVEGADTERQPVDARVTTGVAVQTDDRRRVPTGMAPPADMRRPVLAAGGSVGAGLRVDGREVAREGEVEAPSAVRQPTEGPLRHAFGRGRLAEERGRGGQAAGVALEEV